MGSEMEVLTCMNFLCRVTTTFKWMKGWVLRSGAFATLCYICGTAFENSVYCDTFHKDENGWRECNICRKRVHCGCIASKHLHDYLDLGGIWCRTCENRHTAQRALFLNRGADYTCGTIASSNNGPQSSQIAISEGNPVLNKGKMVSSLDPNHHYPQNQRISTSCPMRKTIQEENAPSLKVPDAGQWSFSPLPKTKSPISKHMTSSQTRAQLLVKNLPKLPNVELQQLFVMYPSNFDLNTTVTPLFQKVLSSSDSGRSGRLILPKVCAEAYLPYISESAGVPIKVLDSSGKEWTFQLRFWNNNNSRMYVFEGVQRYMRDMELQTVIFGQDPEGKLVMGFKKITRDDDHTKDIQPVGVEVTWRHAQDILQPKPLAVCNIVMIEDQEFEEYYEPPVFGYNAEFTSQVLSSRSSRSPPAKRVLKELQSSQSPEPKKPKFTEDQTVPQEYTSCAANPLAIVAVMGLIPENDSQIGRRAGLIPYNDKSPADKTCNTEKPVDDMLESNCHTNPGNDSEIGKGTELIASKDESSVNKPRNIDVMFESNCHTNPGNDSEIDMGTRFIPSNDESAVDRPMVDEPCDTEKPVDFMLESNCHTNQENDSETEKGIGLIASENESMGDSGKPVHVVLESNSHTNTEDQSCMQIFF